MLRAFPALHSRNYQLYFAGQLISLIGTWLQIVAQGWLVLELTNSAFLIGLVTAISTLPSLIFSLFGGVIVDRYNKKHILYFTQISSMILAIILGILTVYKVVNIWEIIVLSFLLGVVSAIDMPARQAYAVDLVKKEALASAIALNSGIFNAARVIGPGFAGLLIAAVGTGGAFILNGISFLAVVLALYHINTVHTPVQIHPNPFRAIKEGLVYSFSHEIIRPLLIFVGVVSVFGWSYATIMPMIAKNTFHFGPSGLGYLYASSGLGALISTIVISSLGSRVKEKVFIVVGNTIFAICMILFTFTNQAYIAFVLLFIAGFGLLLQFSTMNSTIQHHVSNEVRGRVMSIYSLMFLGLSPLGNFEVGVLAQHFGPEFAIRVGAIIILIFGLYFSSSFLTKK